MKRRLRSRDTRFGRHKRAMRLAVLGASLLIGRAQGTETNTPAVLEAVTLEDCLQRALSVADAGGHFDAEAQLARADLMAARARSRPHLNLRPELRYYPEDAEAEPFISADLGQHLLDLPQNRLHRRIARRNMTGALLDQAQAQHRRRMDVLRAYAGLLKSTTEMATSALRLELAEKQVAAWHRIEGDEPHLRAEREASQAARAAARAGHDQAVLQRDRARRELNRLCDWPVTQTAQLEPLPPFELPPVALAECLDWARTHRPDLARMRHDLQTTDTMIRLAGMRRLPTAGLSFGYTDLGRDEFDEKDEGGAFVGLQVHIPLWDAGETRAGVERLRARRQSMELQLATLQAQIDKTVTSAFLVLRERHAAWQALEADEGPEREHRSAKIQFAKGRVSSLEFDAATLRRAAHEAKQRETQLECYTAQADLLEAIGATRSEWSRGLPTDAPESADATTAP